MNAQPSKGSNWLLLGYIAIFVLLIFLEAYQLYYLFLLSGLTLEVLINNVRIVVNRLRQIAFLLIIGTILVIGVTLFVLILPLSSSTPKQRLLLYVVIGAIFALAGLVAAAIQLARLNYLRPLFALDTAEYQQIDTLRYITTAIILLFLIAAAVTVASYWMM